MSEGKTMNLFSFDIRCVNYKLTIVNYREPKIADLHEAQRTKTKTKTKCKLIQKQICFLKVLICMKIVEPKFSNI